MPSALTQAEWGIWLGQQRAAEASVYNACECLVLRGAFEEGAFQLALERVLRAAPWLSARFLERAGGPERVLPASDEFSVALARRDASQQPDPKAALVEYAQAEVRRSFLPDEPLFRHSLVRLGPGEVAWVHVAHHLLLDGFGFYLVQKRVAEAYRALEQGESPTVTFAPLEPVLVADQLYQTSPERERDAEYWKGALGRAAGITWGPLERTPLAHASRRLVKVSLPEDLGPLTPLDWLGARLSEWLLRETGETRFQLGLPVMLRLGAKALNVPCMAMNIVPVLFETRGLPRSPTTSTWRVWAERMAEARRASKPYERFRYEHMRSLAGAPDAKLFGPVLNFMPFEPGLRFGSLEVSRLPISAGPVEDLAFALSPSSNGFELCIDAHPGIFSDAQVEALAAMWAEPWPADSAARPSSGAPLSEPLSPLEVLLDWAKKTPHACAIEEDGRRLSYAELSRAIVGAARWLECVGVEADELVALDLPRGALALVIVLGILARGAAYVALDRSHPERRYQQILEQAAPKLVITELGADEGRFGRFASRVLPPESIGHWLELEAKAGSEAAVEFAAPEALAYVVFTSGSTGEPKGVAVAQRALAHFTRAAQKAYEIRASDRLLAFAPLSFDASVEELFVSLASGATLVVRPLAMLDSLSNFSRLAEELSLTILDLPTAFFHEWTMALEQGQAKVPSLLRKVLIGGEAALLSRVRSFKKLAPGVALLNTYGPSEATVVATFAELGGDEPKVPIGRPLDGVLAHILAADGSICTGAAEGQLALSGPTLASGYLGAPNLTAKKFVQFAGVGRLYLTGDRVSRDANGELFFEGRVDDEFKLSGYRVVPAEIEAALSAHPGIVDAAVLGVTSPGGLRVIVAHVQGVASLLELRAFLRERLPEALVPSRIEFHEALPKSSQGKLDRGRLRALSEREHEARPAPQGGALARVLEVWQEVLGRSDFDFDDDFFVVGGTSLQTLQVASRLSSERELRVADIFRHPTPRALAAYLDGEEAVPLGDSRTPTDGSLDLDPSEIRPSLSVTRPVRRVVLTGALGLVGGELLRALLSSKDVEVICALRGNRAQSAQARLEARLASLGLSARLIGTRLIVCEVELDKPESVKAAFGRLPEFEILLHAAASVSLTRDYSSLRGDNVLAVRNLLIAASERGAEFHHISSLAVAPKLDSIPEQFFAWHAGLTDGYQKSKWQAELLCEQARLLGLRTAVYRLGRITGARRAAFIQRSDILWRIARASVRARVFPALDVEEIWTPADDAASTVVRLMQAGAAGFDSASPDSASPDSANFDSGVYQITHCVPVRWSAVHETLRGLGAELELAPLGEWLERVAEQADEEDQATLLFFELRRGQSAKFEPLHYECAQVTKLLGGERLRIEPELLRAYCEDLLAEGTGS